MALGGPQVALGVVLATGLHLGPSADFGHDGHHAPELPSQHGQLLRRLRHLLQQLPDARNVLCLPREGCRGQHAGDGCEGDAVPLPRAQCDGQRVLEVTRMQRCVQLRDADGTGLAPELGWFQILKGCTADVSELKLKGW